ncbi:MAG: TonB family protein [Myxococcota bacterium]
MLTLLALLSASAEETFYSSLSGRMVAVTPSVVQGSLPPGGFTPALTQERLLDVATCLDTAAPPEELTAVLSVDATGVVTSVSMYAEPSAPAAEACVQKAAMAVSFRGGPARVQLVIDPDAKLDLTALIGRRGVELGRGDRAAHPTDPPHASGPTSGGLPPPYTPTPGVSVHDHGVIILGALDKSLLDGVVRANLGALETCYARARESAPDTTGRIAVKFVVDETGAVSSTTVKSTTTNHQALDACVVSAFYQWPFPAPKGGGIVIATYPIDFVPE